LRYPKPSEFVPFGVLKMPSSPTTVAVRPHLELPQAGGASTAIELARDSILTPSGLDEQRLARVLDNVMGYSVDYADLYFQLSRDESWSLEDGMVKDGTHSIEQGVGVRALAGEKTGFAYSDEIVLPALTEASQAARAIARAGASTSLQAWHPSTGHQLYLPFDPLEGLSDAEKVRLLEQVDIEARRCDPRVTQVMASLSGAHEVVMVVASDGTLAADVRPLVRMNVSVIVEHNGRREQGYCGSGGRYGFARFLANDRWKELVKEAVRGALVNLEAVAAPAGSMTVVLGPGWPGILLHEAIGHGLEGDFNRKGTSAFSGRVGEMVADAQCTVVDDGTLGSRRGSLNIDDEGTPTQCTTLIEDGVLRGYLQDKLNARLMGVAPTGNGRRESFAHMTLPRMTNTYMLPGRHDPQEIIKSVSKGIYCKNFGGGQVDITSGKFVFSASEAYLIENGKLTAPVRGATLIGNGPDVLRRVTMVGNDLKLDEGVGTCGKEGQDVPVGVGQPTLRVDGLTVGGTATG
jgi:TldD protein